MITFQIMTPDQWNCVADNPMQRDTVIHAKRAILGHLKSNSATHARVAAAVLPDGSMYKLDGHTRAYLWKIGKLTPPESVMIDVYHVPDIAGVTKLYECFDNAGAAESASDKLRGAFRLHGIKPISGIIIYSGLNSALKSLYEMAGKKGRGDIYAYVGNFKHELMIIDSTGMGNNNFSSPILASFILLLRIHGEIAIEFFTKYNSNQGIKDGNKRDAVQALREYVELARAKNTLASNGAAVNGTISKCISAFESYRAGRMYVTGIKPTDVRAYIDKYSGIVFPVVDENP